MSWTIIIILIIIGLLALILEFIVIPGGIVGILGGLCVLGSIIMAYSEYGTTAGHITLISSAIALIILAIFLLRSKSWKRLSLETTIDSKVNDDENLVSVGMQGTSITRLALTGNAIFGDKIIAVTSEYNFIDENTPIVITRIEGYNIFVKPLPISVVTKIEEDPNTKTDGML